MRRTNISLTDEQYDLLKLLRHTEGGSMSHFVHCAIDAHYLDGVTPAESEKFDNLVKKAAEMSKPPEKKPQRHGALNPHAQLFKQCKHDKNLCKKCIGGK